jgi:hypothetical protein
VYQTDNGKYLSFTALYNGATYNAAQQVTLSVQQGDLIIASADVSAASAQKIQKKLGSYLHGISPDKILILGTSKP